MLDLREFHLACNDYTTRRLVKTEAGYWALEKQEVCCTICYTPKPKFVELHPQLIREDRIDKSFPY